MSSCCAPSEPSQIVSSRLAASDPTIHPADQPPRIVAAARYRRDRQWKARAPQEGARKHRERASHEVELELEPRVGGERRVDRPERERRVEQVRRPRHGRRQQQLAPGQGYPRARQALRERRADAAAHSEASQKDGQDQRKRVRRRAEQERQHARPQDLRT
jgi:hypothetical protein